MTIITKQHAQRLIRTGKAQEIGTCKDDHNTFWVINRLDLCRVDHVKHSQYGNKWHLAPLTKLGRAA